MSLSKWVKCLSGIFSVVAVGGCKLSSLSVQKSEAKNQPRTHEIERCQKPTPRAAFDIGSGSTKLRISLVTKCEKATTLFKNCASVKAPIAYSTASKLNGNKIPSTFVVSAISSMAALVKQAKEEARVNCPDISELEGIPMRGVMTAVFRDSEFSSAWAAKAKISADFSKQLGLGLPLKILSQAEEGYFGAYPALTITGIKPSDVVVWDMGGGSTQIGAFSGDSAATAGFTLLEANKIGTGTFVNGTELIPGVNSRLNASAGGSSKTNMTLPGLNLNIEKVKIAAIAMVESAMTRSSSVFSKPKNLPENSQVSVLKNKIVFGIGGTWARTLPEVFEIYEKEQFLPRLSRNDTRALKFEELNKLSQKLISERGYLNKDVEIVAEKIGAMSPEKLQEFAAGTRSAQFSDTLSQGVMLAYAYLSQPELRVERVIPLDVGASDTLLLHPQFDDVAFWNQDCTGMAEARGDDARQKCLP